MGKVVAGGLLAGLVLNLGDMIINGVLLAADFEASMARLGLDPAVLTSVPVAVTWIAVDFLVGLLLVWSYAAMRPRFGPGPKTAILGAVPLVGGVTLVLFGFTMMGYFTSAVFVKGTIASVINAAIGAVVGAWMYSEA
jgi:hypothetical protein